jgi:hypothetical protein
MWAHEHMAHERRFDKTTDRQALLPEFVRLCFLCGFGPGSSKRNWVRRGRVGPRSPYML